MSGSLFFETTLSKISAMQRTSQIAIFLLVGVPLFALWTISIPTSFLFIFPIWIAILVFNPDWLIPLFIIGPVVSALALYFHVRFTLWRRGETRPWSHRTLILFIPRHIVRTALFGHGVGVFAILASLVLRVNTLEFVGEAGEIVFWFGPKFYDGPVEQALFDEPAATIA